MKTVFLSLTIVASLASALGAFAAPVQDKAITASLHRIEDNSKLVHVYAHIYEWDNVDFQVDRIVTEEKKVVKALEGVADSKQKAEELQAAVKDLRSARLNQDSDHAVAAADKVAALAHDLLK